MKTLIFLIILLFLSGCVTNQKQYEEAIKACENFGGFSRIVDWLGDKTIICVDDTKIVLPQK